MAGIFNRQAVQAGAPVKPPLGEPTVFEKIMAELASLEEPVAPPPMPIEQQRANVTRNNDLQQLGVLGQMSGDEAVQRLGGSIFKTAMSRAEPQVTPRGTLDQLTGQFTPGADVLEQRREARQDRLFRAASSIEEARRRAEDRKDAAAEAQANREANIRLAASLRAGASADSQALKDELTRARIEQVQTTTANAADKAEAAKTKKESAAQNAVTQGQIVMKKIDEAMTDAGKWTTGLSGSIFKHIPGTTAYDLRKTIDTIKANVGFEQLSAMRQASPTGGALGQVAVKELDMLQATIANLDADQKHETVLKNLKQVRQHYENWVRLMQEHARSVPPGTGGGSGASAPVRPVPGAGPALPAPGGGGRLRYDPVTGEFK